MAPALHGMFVSERELHRAQRREEEEPLAAGGRSPRAGAEAEAGPEPARAPVWAKVAVAALAAVVIVGAAVAMPGRSDARMALRQFRSTQVQGAVATVTCAASGENCMKSKCCQQEGFQCYSRDARWASCKSTCTEGGWDCKELGDRAPSNVSAVDGAGPGEICAVVQKCKQEGYQCFQMNDYYSGCKVTCSAKGWTCKTYGERTPTRNTTECAWGADLCAPQGCCVGEGLQCYERDEYWSSCMSSCERTMDFGTGPEQWSCKKVGPRRKVELGCSWKQEECTATKSCCHPEMQCIQKDDRRSYCWGDAAQPGWAGNVVGGGRSEWAVQPAEAGHCLGTTLFCVMAVLPGSYEESLVEAARSKQASIFACDASAVFNSWSSAHADEGTWHSVVNTDVFVNVYENIRDDRRFLHYDWTVKIDPDSVFFPDRLRWHLGQLCAPADMPVYIKNAKVDFGFLGAIEVFSKTALVKYFRYYRECFQAISAHSGEDGFMKGCMDMVGAGYMFDDSVLHTPHHDGACSDPGRVCFHAFKDVAAWDQCYNEAAR